MVCEVPDGTVIAELKQETLTLAADDLIMNMVEQMRSTIDTRQKLYDAVSAYRTSAANKVSLTATQEEVQRLTNAHKGNPFHVFIA